MLLSGLTPGISPHWNPLRLNLLLKIGLCNRMRSYQFKSKNNFQKPGFDSKLSRLNLSKKHIHWILSNSIKFKNKFARKKDRLKLAARTPKESAWETCWLKIQNKNKCFKSPDAYQWLFFEDLMNEAKWIDLNFWSSKTNELMKRVRPRL